jgi:hypothetical protein
LNRGGAGKRLLRAVCTNDPIHAGPGGVAPCDAEWCDSSMIGEDCGVDWLGEFDSSDGSVAAVPFTIAA